MPAKLDITGQRYGDLVAVSRNASKRYPCGAIKSLWLFRCDCGAMVEKTLRDIRRGDTKSCGCRKHRSHDPHNRLPDGVSSFNCLMASYARRARLRGLPFTISRDEFRALTADECYYCGSPPLQSKMGHKSSNGAYKYNGLDRIDSKRGYTRDNVVTCCGRCNVSKNDMHRDEFLSWVRRVYERCL